MVAQVFLSCLFGSEDPGPAFRTGPDFLSCLFGSEDISRSYSILPFLSELPIRQ